MAGYLFRALDAVLRVAVVPVQHVAPVPPHLRHPRRIPPAAAVPPPHPVPDLVHAVIPGRLPALLRTNTVVTHTSGAGLSLWDGTTRKEGMLRLKSLANQDLWGKQTVDHSREAGRLAEATPCDGTRMLPFEISDLSHELMVLL